MKPWIWSNRNERRLLVILLMEINQLSRGNWPLGFIYLWNVINKGEHKLQQSTFSIQWQMWRLPEEKGAGNGRNGEKGPFLYPALRSNDLITEPNTLYTWLEHCSYIQAYRSHFDKVMALELQRTVSLIHTHTHVKLCSWNSYYSYIWCTVKLWKFSFKIVENRGSNPLTVWVTIRKDKGTVITCPQTQGQCLIG